MLSAGLSARFRPKIQPSPKPEKVHPMFVLKNFDYQLKLKLKQCDDHYVLCCPKCGQSDHLFQSGVVIQDSGDNGRSRTTIIDSKRVDVSHDADNVPPWLGNTVAIGFRCSICCTSNELAFIRSDNGQIQILWR